MDAIRKIEAALSGFTTFPVWHETSPDDVVHAVRNENARIVADVGYSGDEDFDKTICAYIASACPAAIREVFQTLASKETELVKLREVCQAMAEDGWLYHGVEGMSDPQKLLYSIITQPTE